MAYPSTISSFTNPQGSEKLNSPSHSAIEVAQNTALTEIMNAVGTDASTIGTIIGDLRNANSGGGGHVQSANKGGTGQTSFTKGDVLVATSSSVLSKLALGTDTQVLTVDSNQQAGIKWSNPGASKIFIGTNSVVISTTSQATMFAVSVAGGTLSSVNGVRFEVPIEIDRINGGNSHHYRLNYGGNMVASVTLTGFPADANSVKGVINGYLFANNAVSSQIGFIGINVGIASLQTAFNYGGVGTIGKDSSTEQPLQVTAETNNNPVNVRMFVVEKIE